MATGLILVFAGNSALAGDKTGNGGDILAMQFFLTAENVLRAAESIGQSQFPGIDLVTVRAAISKAMVSSTEEILRGQDGQPRDALNYPNERRIIFNAESYLASRNSDYQVALAVHESLSVASQEDNDNFTLTYLLLSRLPNPIQSYLAPMPNINLVGEWDCLDDQTTISRKMDIVRHSDDPNSPYRFKGSLVFFTQRNYPSGYADHNTWTVDLWFSPQAEQGSETCKLNNEWMDRAESVSDGFTSFRLLGLKKFRLRVQSCDYAYSYGTQSYQLYWVSPHYTITCTRH